VARLDCYLDPNERKYFITPQSVTLAISDPAQRGAEGPPKRPGAPRKKDRRFPGGRLLK
jgi:hypothetical protein